MAVNLESCFTVIILAQVFTCAVNAVVHDKETTNATNISLKNTQTVIGHRESEMHPEYEPGSEPEELYFKLSARGLPPTDGLHGAPDPFAVVEGTSIYAKTPILNDTYDPEWNTKFSVLFRPGSMQYMRITIYDLDDSGDEFIASVSVNIGWILEPDTKYYFDMYPTNSVLFLTRVSGANLTNNPSMNLTIVAILISFKVCFSLRLK